MLLVCAVLASQPFERVFADSPRLIARTAMSAAPDAIAQGDSGPLNRMTYVVSGLAPSDPRLDIKCLYPGMVVIECRYHLEKIDARRDGQLRLIVEIPDIDRGNQVIVRIAGSGGQIDDRVTLVNRTRIIHEIESLMLQGGGQIQIDGRGQQVPSSEIGTVRAATQIALNTSGSPACGEVYPRWVGANATDPVFTSAFGALPGSVVIARPPRRVPISASNGPEWLITYPRAASRVQFIAHYEIEYRVRYCPAKS